MNSLPRRGVKPMVKMTNCVSAAATLATILYVEPRAVEICSSAPDQLRKGFIVVTWSYLSLGLRPRRS